MASKIILGVDPGTLVAGFGVLRKEHNTIAVLDHGFLKMKSTQPLVERVGIFYDFFSAKAQEWHVTDLALEAPFLGKNSQSFLKLGYVRGALYLIVRNQNLVLHEFSPMQVKQSVTGFGGASKDQVGRVISRLFPRLQSLDKADVTDALAVSLCGAWHQINLLK